MLILGLALDWTSVDTPFGFVSVSTVTRSTTSSPGPSRGS
jgi:hypothetical protein